jgi:hypothetical protein
MEDIAMTRLRIFGIVAGVAILAGCATGRDVPRVSKMLSEEIPQNGRACVRLSDIRSYGVLEDNVVSIDGTRNYYLATVLPGCNDLQASVRSLFSGGFGEICGQSMNKITTRGDSCTINKLYEFKSRDEAFAVYNAILEKRKALQESAGQN